MDQSQTAQIAKNDGNIPNSTALALVNDRETVQDMYKRFKEEKISNLPLSLRQKREEINSRLSIKSIMGINLTLDNISISLNVGKDILKKIDTEENLIKPIQTIKKLEKTFARDLRDVVEDLGNAVVRSVKFYNQENKETLEDYTKRLTNVTKTYDQIETEEKKIEKYIKVIKEASNEHLEYADKIEQKIKNFFKDLSEMAEQIEQVNSGIQTFKSNVDGQQSQMFDEFNAKSKAVDQKSEHITNRLETIKKLEQKIVNEQEMLESLKVATQTDQKQISTNSSKVEKANVKIDLTETYIGLTNNRKQEITQCKKEVNDNLKKVREKQQEYKDKLLKKQEEFQQFNDQITQIEKQIATKEMERSQKEQEREHSWFFQKWFGKNLKEIAILQKEKEKLIAVREIQQNSIKMYQDHLNKTIQTDINNLEEEANQKNKQISKLEQQQREHENKIQRFKESSSSVIQNKIDLQNEIQYVQSLIQEKQKELEEKKSLITEEKKNLQNDQEAMSQLKIELELAQKELEQCMENLTQLERLDIPQDIIDRFKNINVYMNAFAEDLQKNKQSIANIMENFIEESQKFKKRSKAISDLEDEDDFQQAQKKVSITMTNINEEIRKQISEYEKLNLLIKNQYYSILDKSKKEEIKYVCN